jgi:hypothetical protein
MTGEPSTNSRSRKEFENCGINDKLHDTKWVLMDLLNFAYFILLLLVFLLNLFQNKLVSQSSAHSSQNN